MNEELYLSEFYYTPIKDENNNIIRDEEGNQIPHTHLIKRLIVENGITEISNLCRDCKQLIYVELPNTLKIIGDSTFSNCSNLRHINIPSSVTIIGAGTFLGCGFEKFHVPSNITNIGTNSFSGCKNLIDFKFNNKLKVISSGLLSNCESLENITIPDNIEYIEDDAFGYCTNLKNIKLSKNIDIINMYTFSYCTSLETFTINKNIKEIKDYAFLMCSHLKTLIFEHNNIKLSTKAFNGASLNVASEDFEIICYGTNNQYEEILNNLFSKNNLNRILSDIINIKKIIKINYVDQNNKLIKTDEYILSDEDIIELSKIESNLPNDDILFDEENEIFNNEWYIDENNKFENNILNISNITGDTITLKPFIITKEKPQYIITFDYNTNGGNNISSMDYTLDNNILYIEEGSSVDLSKIKAEKQDYEFIGWNISPTTTDGIKSIVTPKSNITYYAIYKKDITLTFYFGSSKYMQKEYKYSIYNNNDTTKSITINTYLNQETYNDINYSFCGWLNSNDVNTYFNTGYELKQDVTIDTFKNSLLYGENASIKLSNNTTYYAVYYKEFTIQYNLNGGNGITPSKQFFNYYLIYDNNNKLNEVKYNISIDNSTDYTKEDYIFNGWYYIIDNETKYINNSLLPATPYYINLYINWTNIHDKYYTFDFDETDKTASLTGIVDGANIAELFDENDILELPSTILNNGNEYIVTSIGGSAFSSNQNLKHVIIPSNVKKIYGLAFEHCYNLETIELPDTLEEIVSSSLKMCCNLSNIILSENNVNYIVDDNVLFNNDKSNLIRYPSGSTNESYIIPDNVSELSSYSFSSAYNLKNLSLSNNIQYIRNYAFEDCDGFETIVLPKNESLYLGMGVFSACTNLKTIYINDNLYTIGKSAFETCHNLTYVYYNGTDENWNKVLILGGNDSLINATIFYNMINYLSYKIDNNEVTITGCNKSINGSYMIPSTINNYPVTTIGASAFEDCVNLIDIAIPNSINNMKSDAFANCKGLTNVYINDIKSWCNIKFNDNVASIWANPIVNHVNLYINNELITNLIIPNDVEIIYPYAFYGCDNIESVTIEEGVKRIMIGAFGECSKLKIVIIPSSIEELGLENWAFDNCVNLTDIYYAGTEEQWNDILVSPNDVYLKRTTIHYNYTGE